MVSEGTGAAAATRPRLVVVSNRGAHELKKTGGSLQLKPTVGGLATAVEPILAAQGGIWVSWLGRTIREDRRLSPQRLDVPATEPRYTVQEVLLSETELKHYYHGFANDCLWPLCHSFLERARFEARDWEQYHRVNGRFAAATVDVLGADDLVWLHDFHLTLVPGMMRQTGVNNRIAFFWHVPFPPIEIFEALPWARPVLEGLLGSDVVAFHLEGYAHNFLRCAQEVLGADVDYDRGRVRWGGRSITVQALPIGIDDGAFADLARSPKVRDRARAIRRALGRDGDFLMLGVGRLDYTKGILERLEAVEMLLDLHPEYRGRLTHLEVVVPSRQGVKSYRELRRRVEEAVGRINGRFGDDAYMPVHYRFRALPRPELVAHYLAADVAVVTPLRDGLNLVAKEYVAARVDRRGVLVLSPLAGVAQELTEAVQANPYDQLGMIKRLIQALEMTPAEQEERMRKLQDRIHVHNLEWWWGETTRLLATVARATDRGSVRSLTAR